MGPGGHPGFMAPPIWVQPISLHGYPLLRLEHDISAALENGKFVLAVFFDLQKAYDTTWKCGILRKLPFLGFCGHLPLFIGLLVG